MKALIALLAVGATVGSVAAQTPAPAAPYVVDGMAFRAGQGDPADSLYRTAHELLARGEYGRSAELFRQIAEKFPKSRYQDEVTYNEAFARYRIGATRELETAARLLEPRAKSLLGDAAESNKTSDGRPNGKGRGRTDGDVVGLYVRVNQALAQRGNSDAEAIVKNVARTNANWCDSDRSQFQRDAISALSQMDPPQALPIIKRVLATRDECNVDLRRSVVFILGRGGDAEAAPIIASTAKSDPSPVVRSEAVSWLPKLSGDAGVSQLEDILRSEQDERILRSVVRTLASSNNARARSSVRALIDRKDAPIDLRIVAINASTSEHATSDDAAYLRDMYSRADNDQIKQAIVSAVSRINGKDSDEWILGIAKNPNESSDVRNAAINRVVQSGKIADWIALYDAAQSLSVRQRLLSALESRKEPEAADKLLEVAKQSTVSSLRLQALSALTRRKDPRVPQLLDDIMTARKP